MADTVDSKSAVARRVGSSPTIRIYYLSTLYMGCAFIFLYSNTPTQINYRKSQNTLLTHLLNFCILENSRVALSHGLNTK